MKNVRLPVSYLLEQCSTHHSLLRQGTIASDNNDNGWSKRWPTRAWLIHHRSCEWSATWRRCTTGYAANQRQSDDPDRPCSTCARRNTCESWRSSDLQTHNINLQLTLYCGSVPRAGSRGCKNRPTPFPGRMSYKATKPGSCLFSFLA